MLLEQGVSLEKYVVDKESEDACLFLAEHGCNVPAEHRSATCLSYVCYDKLGPKLASSESALKNFVRADKLLRKTSSSLDRLRKIPFPEKSPGDFGNS